MIYDDLYKDSAFNSSKVQLEPEEIRKMAEKYLPFNSSKVQLERDAGEDFGVVEVLSIPVRYN